MHNWLPINACAIRLWYLHFCRSWYIIISKVWEKLWYFMISKVFKGVVFENITIYRNLTSSKSTPSITSFTIFCESWLIKLSIWDRIYKSVKSSWQSVPQCGIGEMVRFHFELEYDLSWLGDKIVCLLSLYQKVLTATVARLQERSLRGWALIVSPVIF